MIEAQVGSVEETSAANVDHLQIRESQASLLHLEHRKVYFPQRSWTPRAVGMPDKRFHTYTSCCLDSRPSAPPAMRSAGERTGTPICISLEASGLRVTRPVTARTGRRCSRRIWTPWQADRESTAAK